MEHSHKKEKLKDASKAGFGLLIDSLLEIGSEAGTEAIREVVTNESASVLVEILSSTIPGISGAISSYKRIRVERNLKAFIGQLNDKHKKLIVNLERKTKENREKLDQLLLYILELTIDEYQEEKIKYMVNGYLNLTAHDEFSSDFVMHYYDMLKQLRWVDISVLKLYNQRYDLDYQMVSKKTYEDIMDKHGITYEQYNSVREILVRYGLLEIEIKENTEDDMNKLEKGLNTIISYIEHINKGRKTRPPKISKVKIRQRSKERIKLSKFGREFYKFFVSEINL